MEQCKDCQYGAYPNSLSDICDDCRNDPGVGLCGGFTDHSIGKHFLTEKERDEWYKNQRDKDDN